MSDTARVLFPIDADSAVAALRGLYGQRGRIGCLVTPKRVIPNRLDGAQAQALVDDGAIVLAGDLATAEAQFITIGAYQAEEALKAHARMTARGRRSCVTAVLEPGRFREPRDGIEAAFVTDDVRLKALFPPDLPRVILTHTRPEPMIGLLRRIDGGPGRTRALGYISRGGTLDVPGMLFANRCTWAHAVGAAADLLETDRSTVLEAVEVAAIEGRHHPRVLAEEAEPKRKTT